MTSRASRARRPAGYELIGRRQLGGVARVNDVLIIRVDDALHALWSAVFPQLTVARWSTHGWQWPASLRRWGCQLPRVTDWPELVQLAREPLLFPQLECDFSFRREGGTMIQAVRVDTGRTVLEVGPESRQQLDHVQVTVVYDSDPTAKGRTASIRLSPPTYAPMHPGISTWRPLQLVLPAAFPDWSVLDVSFGGRSLTKPHNPLSSASRPDYTLELDGISAEHGTLVVCREGSSPGVLKTTVAWQSIEPVSRRYRRFAERWHPDGIEGLTSLEHGWKMG